MRAVALILGLAPALAIAEPDLHPPDARTVSRATEGSADDPCVQSVIDPIVTPVRDLELDAQRSACLRREVFARVLGHALIDTPNFHGVLGAGVSLGARFVIGEAFELSAQLPLVDYNFVQTAVNKVTNTGVGPLVLGAATGDWIGDGARGAVVAQLELPYTRDQMDTLRVSGALSGVITGQLARSLVLHARIGGLAMHAESVAGAEQWLAFRAGADLVWHLRTRLALQAGSDVSAGWHGGFDHVLVRAGVHWRMTRGDWRLRAGVGAPLAGAERTNAVIDLAVVHGL